MPFYPGELLKYKRTLDIFSLVWYRTANFIFFNLSGVTYQILLLSQNVVPNRDIRIHRIVFDFQNKSYKISVYAMIRDILCILMCMLKQALVKKKITTLPNWRCENENLWFTRYRQIMHTQDLSSPGGNFAPKVSNISTRNTVVRDMYVYDRRSYDVRFFYISV